MLRLITPAWAKPMNERGLWVRFIPCVRVSNIALQDRCRKCRLASVASPRTDTHCITTAPTRMNEAIA